MKDRISQQTIYLGSLALLVLIWLLAYAVPTFGKLKALAASDQEYLSQRKSLAQTLVEYAQTKQNKVSPAPNTTGWITQHVVTGLETNLEFNNPYNNGAGAHLKLRSISADQFANILDQLKTTNLIVKSLKLEDRDGDGRWHLELMVEVPL